MTQVHINGSVGRNCVISFSFSPFFLKERERDNERSSMNYLNKFKQIKSFYQLDSKSSSFHSFLLFLSCSGLGQQVVITGPDSKPQVIKVESSSDRATSQATAMSSGGGNTESLQQQDCQVIQTPTGQTLVIMSPPQQSGQQPSIQPRMITINPTPSGGHNVIEGGKMVYVKSVNQPSQVLSISGAQSAKVFPKPAILQSAGKVNNHHGEGDAVISPKLETVASTDMSGVLSAIASRVVKTQLKSESNHTTDGKLQSSGDGNTKNNGAVAVETVIHKAAPSIGEQLAQVFPPLSKKLKTSPVILRSSGSNNASTASFITTTAASTPAPAASSALSRTSTLALVPGNHGSSSVSGIKTSLSMPDVKVVSSPPPPEVAASDVIQHQQRIIDYPVILEDGSQVIVQQLHNVSMALINVWALWLSCEF